MIYVIIIIDQIHYLMNEFMFIVSSVQYVTNYFGLYSVRFYDTPQFDLCYFVVFYACECF